ncbi:MAG: GIY-YIG nuclease family protein [Spirochaetota bacterium]
MGKKLTVYLIDENDNGPRTIEIGNWSGKSFYSPRANLLQIIDRPEFSKPGVYVLKSDPTDDAFQERIYIGEAEKIGNRLKQHLKDSDKDFKEVVVFISKDELLTKSHIKYIESRLVTLARNARNSELDNANQPSESALSEADISDMEYFIGQIKFILPVVGFSFLVPNTLTKDGGVSDADISQGVRYFASGTNVKAELVETAEGFVVLKGSLARRETGDSFQGTYQKHRNKLSETGILVEKGEVLEFLEDTTFTSLSAAATVVFGRASSGPETWKDATGKSYKELQAKALSFSAN